MHERLRSLQPSTLRNDDVTFLVRELRDQFIRHGYDVDEHSMWTMRPRETHMKFFVEYCEKFGVRDISELNNIVINQFFTEYSLHRQKSTVNTARRTLKVFLRWVDGYKETTIRANPDAIKLVKTRSKLPQAIADHIVSKVIMEAHEEQDSLIIAVFREAGLRIGEIVELRVEDVFDCQIRITESKDLEDRVVNITGMLALRLRRFAINRDSLPHDWLFQNIYKGYGQKMTIKTVRIRVQKCFMEIADLKMKPKQLRDSMAIGLLRSGCDLVTIQTQLGHKDIQTTMIYLRIENSFFKESYARSMPKSILSY